MKGEEYGSAFPLPEYSTSDGRRGMLLRDWFASTSSIGIGDLEKEWWYKPCAEQVIELARMRYLFADAMLAERSK